MPVRTASADAHRKGQDSGLFCATTEMIVDALKRVYPKGLTRREIERETGLRANQVSGRVNYLITEAKRAKEQPHKRECSVTRNLVGEVVLRNEHGTSVPYDDEVNISREDEFTVSDEIAEWVKNVLKQPTQEGRSAVVAQAPFHIREKVFARAKHEYEQQQRERKAGKK